MDAHGSTGLVPGTSVRLGVIGAGIMGERLLRAAQDQAEVLVSGVWDPSGAALARIGRVLPMVPHLDSAEAVVDGCDCVYIASPPASHLSHARLALARGRAVFCEKPLAVDEADATRFMQEAGGERVAVNFPFASSPAVRQLEGWLEAGALGTPSSLAISVGFATWPRVWQRDAAGWLDSPEQGGFTREVVSHFLFLARRLLGTLELLDGEAIFPEPGHSERAIQARLRAGGLPVSLSGSVGATAAEDTNSFILSGSSGAIRLRDWATAERSSDSATWHGDPAAIAHEQARPMVLRRQLEGVSRLTHGLVHRLATLAEAREIQAIVEAIRAGAPS